jgi:outer membrane protein OmpA-like peptidoglycan-associated protein
MRHALSFVICLSTLLGCAKSQTVAECAPEPWEGECQLASITKVEDKEFPIPHVVMEAVYRPVANARFPTYTPGALAERTLVKSQYELPLYDYLEAHPRVACAAQAPAGGACVAPKVTIALAPFNPETAAQVAAAPPVTGCAQIEATGSQDAVRQSQAAKTVVAQKIAFAENSSELPPDANDLTGQVAEQRAKAVRDLLGAHGVSLGRLLTIGATAKVFGQGSRPAEADPADRRVSFSVLLERATP